jgi:hypothetical protein
MEESMTNKQHNRYRMYKTVTDWLAEHRDMVQTMPALVIDVDRLHALIVSLEENVAVQETVAVGKTSQKTEKRQSLILALRPVRAALNAYAQHTGDAELREITGFSESSLRNLRQKLILDKAQHIYDRATSLTARLADFAISASELEALRNAIAAFDVSANQKEMGILKRHTARVTIESIMAEIDSVLSDRVDVMIKVLCDKYPAFNAGYLAARVVHNLGTRHEPPAPPPAPPTPPATQG